MDEGPWLRHSHQAARLAERIADKAGMDMKQTYYDQKTGIDICTLFNG